MLLVCSPATSLPQLLQWLEQKRWPGAAQSLAGSLHLFPSQYIAGQTHGACWGPRSDATLTVHFPSRPALCSMRWP